MHISAGITQFDMHEHNMTAIAQLAGNGMNYIIWFRINMRISGNRHYCHGLHLARQSTVSPIAAGDGDQLN